MEENEPVINTETPEPVATGSDEETATAGATAPQTDERGVPLENVLAEEKRKRLELEEEVARIKEAIKSQPYAPAQAPTPTQQADPAQKVERFATDPDKYLDSYYNRRRQQEKLQDAFLYVQKKGYNIRQIDGAIVEYGLSTDDPLKAVKTAEKLLALETIPKKSTAPVADRKVEEFAKEQERKEKIKKSATEPGGGKPPAPNTDEVGMAYQDAVKYGDDKGVFNFFKKREHNLRRKEGKE